MTPVQLSYFLQGILLGFPNSAQPGPFQAYLLSQTTQNGWRRTLPAALAPLLSDGLIIGLVLLVLTQLSAQTLGLIQVTGGLFVLYLAWGAWQGFRRPFSTTAVNENREADRGQASQSVLYAGLVNLLGPGPYLFWGTVGGPLLLQAWRQAATNGVAFLLGFYGTLIGGFVALILFFGFVGAMSSRANQILSGISALALAGFGIWQLGQGLKALLA